MFHLLIAGIALLSLTTTTMADPTTEPVDFTPAKTVLGEPFWSSKTMENEPVLFIQEEGKPAASGKLMFTPTGKLTIFDPQRTTQYVEGKDYKWTSGSNTIELVAGSSIPFKTSAQMLPPPGSPHVLHGVLWSEGTYFHDLQMQVNYEHTETMEMAAVKESPLPRTLAKLSAKKPVKIVALGDSITEGYNVSGLKQAWAPPHQPCYAQLVANTLQDRFGSTVTLKNLAVAGTKADWGLGIVPQVTAEKPDLVLLGFGMNHQEPAPAFEAVMRKLRDAVRHDNPDADIILVSPMTANPRVFPVKRFEGYRDVLKDLQTENIVVADVTTVWIDLLKRKPFSDLTGNNVNHPNDFGHVVYAQVIYGLFPKK